MTARALKSLSTSGKHTNSCCKWKQLCLWVCWSGIEMHRSSVDSSYIIDSDLQQSKSHEASRAHNLFHAFIQPSTPNGLIHWTKMEAVGSLGVWLHLPVTVAWPKYQVDWHLKVGDFNEVCHLPWSAGCYFALRSVEEKASHAHAAVTVHSGLNCNMWKHAVASCH